jgi:hypothetical protein
LNSESLKALLEKLAETAERCTLSGVMEKGDLICVLEHLADIPLQGTGFYNFGGF